MLVIKSWFDKLFDGYFVEENICGLLGVLRLFHEALLGSDCGILGLRGTCSGCK